MEIKKIVNDLLNQEIDKHDAIYKLETMSQKHLLVNFFLYIRENGDKKVGMSIEDFINEFLNKNRELWLRKNSMKHSSTKKATPTQQQKS